MEFEATAYCAEGTTRAGVPAAPGIVAADPRVLPLGSLIRIDSSLYSGIYRVMDTGGLVKGKVVDIFLPSLEAALDFGRRKVQVTILRAGFASKTERAAAKDQGAD
jgi:3D (Asp-Asp-Asp) domain-containing protein